MTGLDALNKLMRLTFHLGCLFQHLGLANRTCGKVCQRRRNRTRTKQDATDRRPLLLQKGQSAPVDVGASVMRSNTRPDHRYQARITRDRVPSPTMLTVPGGLPDALHSTGLRCSGDYGPMSAGVPCLAYKAYNTLPAPTQSCVLTRIRRRIANRRVT